jgi:transposase
LHEDWLLVELDECWFSRFAQPHLQSWTVSGQPLRLVQRQANKAHAQPKALACYGGLRTDTGRVILHSATGQPNSQHTWFFLRGLLLIAHREHKRVLVVIWDNASWHKSKRLKSHIRAYNLAAKRTGLPRLLTFHLPIQSPWLNPIEPHWLHAKRAVCEPHDDLPYSVLQSRLHHYFDAPPFLWHAFKTGAPTLH